MTLPSALGQASLKEMLIHESWGHPIQSALSSCHSPKTRLRMAFITSKEHEYTTSSQKTLFRYGQFQCCVGRASKHPRAACTPVGEVETLSRSKITFMRGVGFFLSFPWEGVHLDVLEVMMQNRGFCSSWSGEVMLLCSRGSSLNVLYWCWQAFPF